MKYLVLTKQLSSDHYTFGKFFDGEDGVIEYLRDRPQDKFEIDVRIIREITLEKTMDFDDQDLIDTYVDLKSQVQPDEEHE
jgi:hypothetical protein